MKGEHGMFELINVIKPRLLSNLPPLSLVMLYTIRHLLHIRINSLINSSIVRGNKVHAINLELERIRHKLLRQRSQFEQVGALPYFADVEVDKFGLLRDNERVT
jgi:hypothetical protein